MSILKEKTAIENGIDMAQLTGLMENLQAHPDAGNVTFKCNTRWQNGTRAFHHFSGYEIDGQLAHQERRKFVVLSDEPTEFGVSDAAPGPGEQLLGALAGCITATTATHASSNAIELTNLHVKVDGKVHIQGMLGLRKDVPVGFKEVNVFMTISGDAPENKLREMANAGYSFSPVQNTLKGGTKLNLEIEVKT